MSKPVSVILIPGQDQVDVTYHPLEDKLRGSASWERNTWNLHIYHSHPTPTAIVELVTTAIKEKDLPKVRAIIDELGFCSAGIAGSFGRGGVYKERDDVLIKKIASDDFKLQKLLLKMFKEAL